MNVYEAIELLDCAAVCVAALESYHRNEGKEREKNDTYNNQERG